MKTDAANLDSLVERLTAKVSYLKRALEAIRDTERLGLRVRKHRIAVEIAREALHGTWQPDAPRGEALQRGVW